MPKKTLTNDAFMKELMNFGPTGALQQVFILQAITKYAEQVAQATLEELESPFVNPAAWQATAKHILKRYSENYGTA